MRLLLAEDEKATCQKQQSSRPITDRTLRNWRPCQRTRQWCRRLPDQAFFHERTFSTYSCTHKASGTDSFDTRTWLFNHCINGKRSHLFHWLPPVAKKPEVLESDFPWLTQSSIRTREKSVPKAMMENPSPFSSVYKKEAVPANGFFYWQSIPLL